MIQNVQLRREREQRHWSQEQLAQKIGTTALNISRWERGSTSPGLHFRQKLCELFEKSAHELGLIRGSIEEYRQQDSPQSPDQNFVLPLSAEFIYDPAIPPPFATPRLIGREQLLIHLKHLLRTGKNLALNGLPGVGKTALSLGLIKDRAVLEYFRDGILWAALGFEPDILEQLRRWGSLLSIPSAEMDKLVSIKEWTRTIRAVIGTRRFLLVVDDAWRIEDALAFKLGGPNCAHLVTTRLSEIALQFAEDATIVIHELSEDEGVAVIAQFAPEALAREPEEVRALVQSAGELPLALALMGKYLRMHAHSGQHRRLREALHRLRHADERLRLAQPRAPVEIFPNLPPETPLSLQAAINISDQHLNEEAHYTLRALSVFPQKPNTFSEEAALAICTRSVEALDTLTDSSLLEVSGQGRYTLHQVIADYARLHLMDMAVEERMVTYFINYVESHKLDYDAIELEMNNILAALQIASKREMHSDLVRGVNAFSHFLLTRGSYALGDTQLKLVEQAARSLNDRPALSTALLNLGKIEERRGNLAQAEAHYQEGLIVARQAEDPEGISSL